MVNGKWGIIDTQAAGKCASAPLIHKYYCKKALASGNSGKKNTAMLLRLPVC